MTSSGSLTVVARCRAGRVAEIDVQLQRPEVARLFVGQGPEAVVRMVPCLYSLCAEAQRAAAQAALAAATGGLLPGTDGAALWGELLHEHLWRLLLDWPAAVGLPAAKEAFVAWRGARTRANFLATTEALLGQCLLGMDSGAWGGQPAPGSLADRCLARLPAAEAGGGFALPALTPGQWLPYWQGATEREPERERPRTVAGAYRRRLQETVLAVRALAAGAPYPLDGAGGAGWGVGQTLTARGVLTHGARVRLGRIIGYKVWAPTDDFFSGGASLLALAADRAVPDGTEAQRVVDQAVLALDPCVPYEIRISHA